MKKIIILMIIFLFGFAGEFNLNMNKGYEKTYSEYEEILPYNYSNDAAHFKYYENDTHIERWYEWWYLNVKNGSNALLLYFFTFGDLNNPIKSIEGAVALFFKENESIERITSYPFIKYSLDYEKCNVSIAKNRIYEDEGKYFASYKAKDIEINVVASPIGKPFGGNKTMLYGWQWGAWYVAMPYGKANVSVFLHGKEYNFHGYAYHDHNWGIVKFSHFQWNWGEFNMDNEFAVIYGIAKSEGKMKGGIYFVNESNVFSISSDSFTINYLKWQYINGFKKPVKIHIYGGDNNKTVNLYINLKKYYIIGIKNFGKPYLLGNASGRISIKKNFFINTTGFYEYHAEFSKITCKKFHHECNFHR